MFDCPLCHSSQDQDYKQHVKNKCPEYLGALGKTNCPICEVKLTSSSDMMLHLRIKHFLNTKIKIEGKDFPVVEMANHETKDSIMEENDRKIKKDVESQNQKNEDFELNPDVTATTTGFRSAQLSLIFVRSVF